MFLRTQSACCIVPEKNDRSVPRRTRGRERERERTERVLLKNYIFAKI